MNKVNDAVPRASDTRLAPTEAERRLRIPVGLRGAGRPVDVRSAPTEAERRLRKRRSNPWTYIHGVARNAGMKVYCSCLYCRSKIPVNSINYFSLVYNGNF